jgi:hypothetical protein
MKTHYVRPPRKAGLTNKLNHPLEGIVVQAVPADRLVCADEVFETTCSLCRQHQEFLPSPKVCGELLADLAVRGLLVEVHGSRLDRLIAGL